MSAKSDLPVSKLAVRNCVPCRGGVPPLRDDEIGPLLVQLGSPEWHVVERRDNNHGLVKVLLRSYSFKNFAQAMQAAVRIASVAEEQRHHPDLHVSWGKLSVEVFTHAIGGLTESDFILAARCDAAIA